MTRNLYDMINIDVPAAVVDETIVFWSAAFLRHAAADEDVELHAPRPRR